jgi:kynurenine formamidase
MGSETVINVQWQSIEVASPSLSEPVTVIAARGIPYVSNANRFQTFNLYLPKTPESETLVGALATSFPGAKADAAPQYLVHVHGGAWRDPLLTAESIEPTVACAFSTPDSSCKIQAVASINYTISEFPSHPTFPYNSVKDHHSDPAREAVHPQHVSDVLHALLLLRSLGLTERSYILSGHSCGACLAFQSILQPSSYYGLKDVVDAPCPAAILGLNGLYDLPALVDGLGSSHEHLRGDYETLLSNAFGMDKNKWAVASPARFNRAVVSKRVREGKAPQLILLDQSMDDQLVPFNQLEMFEADLRKSEGLSVIRGDRCSGKHAVPWEQGVMVWESVQDTLMHLREKSSLSQSGSV